MNFLEMYGIYLDRELGTVDRTIRFTTARRQAAVNEGQREFARLTQCFTRQATIALSDNVSEYDLESTIAAVDFLRFAKQGVEVKKLDAAASATYFSGDDFPRRDIPWLNRYQPGWRVTTKSHPLSYYLREDGGSVYWGIYPAPSVAAGEIWTGILPYIALPADMTTDADVPYTASANARVSLADWHKAIVHFATAQLEKWRKNTQGYAEQMQLFGGYVTDYLTKQHPKGGQRVTYARTYYRPRGSSDRVRDPRRFP